LTSKRDRKFGFAAAHDAPIHYLQRIRDYYKALGYGAPSPDGELDDCNIERLTPGELRHRPAEFDQGKTQAKSLREEAALTRAAAQDEIA